MRYIGGIAVLGLLICANLDAGQWRVVPGSNRQGESKLPDGDSDSSATFMVTPGDQGKEGAGKESDKEVWVIFDQQTGRAWWECSHRESSAATGSFLPWSVARDQAGSALAGFLLIERSLHVKRSTASARSPGEAQAGVLDAFAAKTKEGLCGTLAATTTINLGQALPFEFFYANGLPASEAKITRVTSDKDGWEIALDGALTPAALPVGLGVAAPAIIRSAVLRLSRDFQIVNVKLEVK